MKAEREILHVDMDAYFASIEQRDVPFLKKKPLAVCHTDDADSVRGVVSTASYEAREWGLKSGISVLEAKKLCPYGIYLVANYEKYLFNTKKLYRLLKKFTDLVEVFSVDEFFLDVTDSSHLFGDVLRVALKIKERIHRELALPCSIGVGPNKLVAKMATEMAKPDGIAPISRDDLPDIFAPLAVDEIPGIGGRIKRSLGALGIKTIGDLAQFPVENLRRRYGIRGEILHWAALGIDESPVKADGGGVIIKSFGHGSALGSGTSDLLKLKNVLLGLVEGVTKRMRREEYLGRTVNIGLCLARLFGRSRSRSLGYFTDKPRKVYKAAQELLEEETELILKYPVTTIRVSVNNLTKKEKINQPSLFDFLEDKETSLLEMLDRIEERYGQGTVTRASLLNFHRRYHSVAKLEIASR